jgi:sugar transferase (PEP-CTERM/EpsH1 system associated)
MKRLRQTMRILVIADKIPFPTIAGAPLRTYNLLRRVAEKHEVWLAAFVATREDGDGVSEMLKFCRGVETAPISSMSALDRPSELVKYALNGIPPDLRAYQSKALTRGIRRILSDVPVDVIQIEHAHMGLYLASLPEAMSRRTAWMLHDIDWLKYARIASLEAKMRRKVRLKLHAWLMRRWIPRHANAFGRLMVVSGAERDLLRKVNPQLPIEVIPNGVDARRYRPLQWSESKPSLLFVGNMRYLPNIEAIVRFREEVLPIIQQQVPGAELWIVGKDPAPAVKQLSGTDVYVTGRVEDLVPFYSRCSVCVVPLRAAGGTRLKILEAMALGRPVVATTIGCEGLEVISGVHLMVADKPEEFARATIRLLLDSNAREAMAKAARKLVVERYDWDVIADRLVRVYEDLAA